MTPSAEHPLVTREHILAVAIKRLDVETFPPLGVTIPPNVRVARMAAKWIDNGLPTCACGARWVAAQ